MKKNAWKFGIASVGAILVLAGCNNTTSTATYTYNTALSSSPATWNVHNWQTSDESYINSFTEIGLYDCILNETKKGYVFVPEMAADMPQSIKPEDVSEEELNRYYADAGNISNGMVWDIPLNHDARWEDGKEIKAADYVDSMELQLNADYANFRADSYFTGNFILANAENYYKQGRSTIESLYKYLDESKGDVPNSTGVYYLNIGKGSAYTEAIGGSGDTTLYTLLNQLPQSGTAAKLAADRIITAYSYYLWKLTDHTQSKNYTTWLNVNEKNDPTQVSQTLIEGDNVDLDIEAFNTGFKNAQSEDERIRTIKSNTEKWSDNNSEVYTRDMFESDMLTFVKSVGRVGPSNKSWAWKLPLFTAVFTYEGATLTKEDIGIKAIDDYTLRIYLAKAITPLNLKFSLTGNWLVNVDLYKKLTITLASGALATTYATSKVENYKSYGPYKLTYFEAGKRFEIKRNDQWYGYHDGKHEGQFQMDEVITHIYSDHTTALQEFMAGRLDDIDLTVTDVRKYGASERCQTTYESYTQKISFNSDYSKLRSLQGGNENKTILANMNFRKGLSLALNRTEFASQATSGSKGFTGLLNDLYLANNATGESYRATDQGKSVYKQVYQHLGGDTIDETNGPALSVDKVGFNRALAIEYVTKGLEEELKSTKSGHLAPGNTISIEFRVYDDSSENTIAAYNNINTTWTAIIRDAVAKLKTSGALADNQNIDFKLTMVKDMDYYTTAKNGGYNIIFSTWGGAAVNPYGLMQVYCDNTFESCCEYGFKGHQAETMLDIDVNGDGKINPSTERKSFDAWYRAIDSGDEYNEAKFGDEVSKDDPNYEAWSETHNKKLTVLAGLEAGILNRFEAVPLVARGTSSLLGFKVENATNTYVSLVGYGGIRFMKFNYTNSGWDEYCKQNGGDLSTLYQN
ncbi:MAG: ABC transporter substrate-binding protein [Erysipelotrichaceae bacterium]|nr:ABC transporter substrate-binding protein [Erysipelotrichaceae bacterium]